MFLSALLSGCVFRFCCHPNIQWVELLAWKRHIIVVVDRPNCMDFIYRTEFEGVQIPFWQLYCKFLLIFTSGLWRPYDKGLIGHCTCGHSLNPPLTVRRRNFPASSCESGRRSAIATTWEQLPTSSSARCRRLFFLTDRFHLRRTLRVALRHRHPQLRSTDAKTSEKNIWKTHKTLKMWKRSKFFLNVIKTFIIS